MSTINAINVIIPMGGLGSRFARDGYVMPKPLVNIMGRPMIFWLIGNLKLEQSDTLSIALQREIDEQFKVCDLIRAEFPQVDIRFILLDGLTRGAAETLYMVTKGLTEEEQTRRTISLDCDTFYFSDVLSDFRNLDDNQGCCCYFIDKGTAPIFSYIDMDGSHRINNIAEKVAISRNANTGAYGFPNAEVVNRYVVELLAKPLPSVGEFYTSALIASMIADDVDFRGIHVDDFECVGTPAQLKTFFKDALQRRDVIESRTVLLDLDSADSSVSSASDLSADAVRSILGENYMTLLQEAASYGVVVKLSFSSEVGSNESGIECASVDERNAAMRKGMVVEVGGDIQKAIGWYEL